jgi:hypothetical protein
MFAAIATLLFFVGATPVQSDRADSITGSYPFMAVNKALRLSSFKGRLCRGRVHRQRRRQCYDWAADGAINVKTPMRPTTRILVRRPSSGFSGTVVVELLFPARRFDWSMMWGFSRPDYRHKDAWVGITLPAHADGLKKFNPARYSGSFIPNPSPNAPCAGAPNNAASPTEDGLRWDMISQVGALLKSNLRAQYLFPDNSRRRRRSVCQRDFANLRAAKPVYDGYLLKAGFNMGRINQCAPAPAANDPRQMVKNVGVPVIAVAAQGEIIGGTYAFRRNDSDEPNDRYRLYEVAAAGHIDKYAYFGFPALADQTKAVGSAQGTVEWPFNAKCEPDIPLMDPSLIGFVFNSSFANFDQWVRKGTPAPRAPQIELKDPGTPQAAVVKLTNSAMVSAACGRRLSMLPDAAYFTNSPGRSNCREMGHKASFDAAEISELYGNRRTFASRLSGPSIDSSRTMADRRRRKATEAIAQRAATELFL